MNQLAPSSGEVPPPLVAELLGYGYNVIRGHAEIAAQPGARYVRSPRRPRIPTRCPTSIEDAWR